MSERVLAPNNEGRAAGGGAGVSVIIVSYNICAFLRRCLRALFGSVSSPIELEVWVVDNASSDGSVEMVRREFPAVRLICNSTNFGFARASNQALAQAGGDFLLLLNPDAEVAENSIARMAHFLQESPGVGIVGGAVTFPGGALDPASHRGRLTPFSLLCKAVRLDRLFPRSRTLAQYNMRWIGPDEVASVCSVSGSFLMIRRETMARIELLDERFFLYYEDYDWCQRARADGWKVYFLPQARTVHEKGVSARRHPDLARLAFHQALLTYFLKHLAANAFLARWLARAMVFTHSGLDRRIFLTSDDVQRLFAPLSANGNDEKRMAAGSAAALSGSGPTAVNGSDPARLKDNVSPHA